MGHPPHTYRARAAVLHDADRIFSLGDGSSPMSRLHRGDAGLGDLDPGDGARITEVPARCALGREISGRAFDPWSRPGGIDPTGLVKGWALADALATGVAVGGHAVLAATDALPGYEGSLITDSGRRHYATPGLPFAPI